MTEIPARLLCTFVPRLFGVRIMRSLGSLLGFLMLLKSSLMSCAEGPPVGELAGSWRFAVVGELAFGLSMFDISSRCIQRSGDEGSDQFKRPDFLRADITCGRV